MVQFCFNAVIEIHLYQIVFNGNIQYTIYTCTYAMGTHCNSNSNYV